MAVIEGGLSGALQEVDAGFLAARVSERPIPAHAWNSIGVRSGLLTNLAADAPIFSLRNLSSNLLLIRRLGFGAITTTAFTEAQAIEFALYIARAFTESDAEGTPIELTGNQAKHRTSLASPTSIDLRIADSTALSVGTRTIDDVATCRIAAWSSAAGETIAARLDNLIKPSPGMYPIVLAQNEGLILHSVESFSANGTVRAYLDIEFAELVAF